MFERLLASLLVKYLGKYVEGIDENNLNLGVWKGDLVLTNLSLRSNALRELKLPIIVKSGFVGKLSLKIPWGNLRYAPIAVVVSDVYAIVGPHLDEESTIDETEDHSGMEAAKMLQLKNMAPDEDQQQSFLNALVTKIVDNLQIEVSNVHIRYEGERNDEWHPPITVGITLDHLSILSTDYSFKPSFITEPHSVIYKLLTMRSFSIYANMDDAPITFSSIEDFKEKMERLIHREGERAPPVQCVVHPISGNLRMILNKSLRPDMDIPRVQVQSLIEQTAMTLTETQYHALIALIDYYSLLIKRWPYRQHRPKQRPKGNPRAWWKYLYKLLVGKSQENRFRWCPDALKQRRKARLEYQNLYKASLIGQGPHDLSERMEEIEKIYSVSDIKYFRAVAHKKMREDGYDVEQLIHRKRHRGESFFSLIVGFFTGKKREQYELSDSERQQLLSAIEYSEEPPKAMIQEPPNYLKFRVNFTFLSGSLSIVSKKGKPIGEISFKEFSAGLKVFPASTVIGLSLLHFDLTDSYTPNTRFPTLVSPLSTTDGKHFFNLVFEYQPLNRPDADIYVRLRSKPLLVIFNKQYVDKIVDFFLDTDQSIVTQSSRQEGVKAIQVRYSEQASWVLEGRKKLEVDVKLEAPRVVIVENWDDDDSRLVVANLGRITIQCSSDENKTKEELLYYTFDVKASSLYLGTSTRLKWLNGEAPLFVLENFTLHFVVETCLISSNASLPTVRILGNLPTLKLNVSAEMFNTLVAIVLSIASNAPQEAAAIQADSSTTTNATRVMSTNVEGAFIINVLYITLLDEKNEPLVVGTLEQISGHFVQRTFDLKIDASLHSLVVEDKVQKYGNRFAYLAFSESSKDTPYIEISYILMQPEDPNYQGVDSALSVSFESMVLGINRETVVRLLDFAQSIVTDVSATLSSPAEDGQRKRSVLLGPIACLLKLSVTTKALKVILNKQGRHIAKTSARTLQLVLSLWDDQSMEVKGSLSSLSVKDLESNVQYSDILSTRKRRKEFIQFKYKTYSLQDPNHPGYSAQFDARVNSIRFVYVFRFMAEMQRYITEIQEMKDLFETTKARATGVVSEFFKQEEKFTLKLHVMAINPYVVVPSVSSNEFIEADFGEIFVYNQLWERVVEDIKYPHETFMASIHAMNVRSYHSRRPGEKPRKILGNLSFVAQVDRMLQRHSPFPALEVLIDIPYIRTTLDQQQFYLLIDLYKQNFLDQRVAVPPSTGIVLRKATPSDNLELLLNISVNLEEFSLNFLGAKKLEGDTIRSKIPRRGSTQEETVSSDTIVKFKIRGKNLDKLDRFGLSDPFLVVYAIAGKTKVMLYRTETIFKTLSPDWVPFNISAKNVCHEEKIVFEVYDYDSVGTNDFIGQFESTLGELVGSKQFDLINPKKRKKKKYQNSGVLEVDCVLENNKKAQKRVKSPKEEREATKDSQRVEKNGDVFASLAFNKLGFKLIQTNDESMFLGVGIDSMQLKDMREAAVVKNLILLKDTLVEMYTLPNQKVKIQVHCPQLRAYFVPSIIYPMWDLLIPGIQRFGKESILTENGSEIKPEIALGPTGPPLEVDIAYDIDGFELHILQDPEKENSPKLIASSSLQGLYRIKGPVQRIIGTMKDFRIWKHSQNGSPVDTLPPLAVSFNYFLSEEQTSITILSDPWNYILSYPDFKVFMGAAYAATSVPTSFIAEYNSMINPAVNPTPFFLNVRIPSVEILLIHECIEIPPLVRLKMGELSLSGNLSDGVQTTIHLESWYYNFTNTYWELLSEPWFFRILFKQPEKGPSKLRIESFQTLEVNISSALIDALNLWMRDLGPSRRAFVPLLVRNLTHEKLMVQLKSMSKPALVDPASDQAIEVEETQRRGFDVLSNNDLDIRYGERDLRNLPTRKSGLNLFSLDGKELTPENTLVYQVSFVNGSRIFSFLSAVVLSNYTTYSLEIKVMNQGGEMEVLPAVPPGGKTSIPRKYLQSGCFSLRPCEGPARKFFWSSKLECATLKTDFFFLNLPSTDSDEFFYAIDTELNAQNSIPLCTVNVRIPVVLENLLCCGMNYRLIGKPAEGWLDSGHELSSYRVSLMAPINFSMHIEGYQWSEAVNINVPQGTITLIDSMNRSLIVHFEQSFSQNTVRIVIYSKYWILNQTPFTIQVYNSRRTLAAGQMESSTRPLENFDPRWEIPNRKPWPYSYSGGITNHRTYIRVENSKKSGGMSLEAFQTGEIKVRTQDEIQEFHLGVSVEVAPQRFRRTKIVTFVPRYRLLNQTKNRIYVQAVGTENRFSIEPDENIIFNWPRRKLRKNLTISPNLGNTWSWSGEFPVEQIGNVYLRLVNRKTKEEFFVRVDRNEDSKGTINVVFQSELIYEVYPYRVENHTERTITFWQTGTNEWVHTVAPKGKMNYTWDEPTLDHEIELKVGDVSFKDSIPLDVFCYRFPGNHSFVASVTADGPTRVIRVCQKEDLEKIASPHVDEDTPTFNAIVELSGFGLSIINSQPKELLYVYIDNIAIEYALSSHTQSLEMIIHRIQIDNQMYFTPHPIVLRPSVLEEDKVSDFFHLALLQKFNFRNILFFKSFSFLMQEVDIAIDTTLANELIRFARLNVDKIYNSRSSIPVSYNPQMIYFEILQINSMKLNVSVYTPMNTSKPDDPLHQLIGVAVPRIPNIDSAPLKLNALILKHPYSTVEDIYSRIAEHYIRQGIRRSYRILGSFEFLGNPVSLFSNLGTGIKDFFVEPIQGIVHGPVGFTSGLKQGTKSLAKRSTYSIFNGGSKATSQLSSGLAYLTRDHDFEETRNVRRLTRPRDVGEGIVEGAKDLGKGFYSGITGIVTQPIKEGRKGGTPGFFKGMGKGLLGATLKPTAGVLDFFSRTMQGISLSALNVDFQRMRLPRYFDRRNDFAIENFSQEKAFRQYVLYSVGKGKYFGVDQPEYHVILGNKMYLVTDLRTMCITVDLEKHHFRIDWKLAFRKTVAVNMTDNSVILQKAKRTEKEGRTRAAKEFVISTEDTSMIKTLYSVIHSLWEKCHENNQVEKRTVSGVSNFGSLSNYPERPDSAPSTSATLSKSSSSFLSFRKAQKYKEYQDRRSKQELIEEREREDQQLKQNQRK